MNSNFQSSTELVPLKIKFKYSNIFNIVILKCDADFVYKAV